MLFSIGLVFMAVAAVDYFMGSQQQILRLPTWLQGRTEILGVSIGRYRAFVIVVCALLVVLLQRCSRIRALAASSERRWTTLAWPGGSAFRSIESLL